METIKVGAKDIFSKIIEKIAYKQSSFINSTIERSLPKWKAFIVKNNPISIISKLLVKNEKIEVKYETNWNPIHMEYEYCVFVYKKGKLLAKNIIKVKGKV